MPNTIQVPDDLKARLARLKKHPRQPFAEVIAEALDYLEEGEKELSPASKRALAEARNEFKAGHTKSMAATRRELGLWCIRSRSAIEPRWSWQAWSAATRSAC